MTERKQCALDLIPRDQLSAEQKAFRAGPYTTDVPMYTLHSEPTYFHDISWNKHGRICIWRNNGTIICREDCSFKAFEERSVGFTIYDEEDRFDFVIYGKTDVVIAETTAFVWSLKDEDDESSILEVSFLKYGNDFDFRALQSEQLAYIFDANPKRHFCFCEGQMSAEQSIVLATRKFPLNITLDGFHVKDYGASFVDALEKRQPASFGLFKIDNTYFTNRNVERLFKLAVTFEKLEFNLLDKNCAHLPLCSKTNSLKYQIDLERIRPSDIDSINIATPDLTLKLYTGGEPGWCQPLVSLFDRMAAYGQLESLRLSAENTNTFQKDMVYGVNLHFVEAFIRMIKTNPKLGYLDIYETQNCVSWSFFFQKILEAMEDHKGLRSFVLDDLLPPASYPYRHLPVHGYPPSHNPAHDWLEQLLSRNRNISVHGRSGRYTNGGSIDELYALNYFFNATTKLKSLSLRPLLVLTALVERASKNFRYSAILLSNHTDVLCEFMRQNTLDIVQTDSVPPAATLPDLRDSPKLNLRTQPRRAAKKAKSR
jgi:hypothetical protein